LIAREVSGGGPPVVLVHGLTSSRRAWDPVVERLEGDFTCVRLDLPGHGESSAAADYSMLSLVAAVRSVVEELGLERPAMVGHSLGATVATVYTAVHGAAALVIVDQSLRFGDFAAMVQARAERLRSERTMEELLAIEHELVLEPYSGIDEMERRILAFPRDVVLGLWEAVLATPPPELTATAEALLPHVSAPLLALHGSPPPADYEAWLTALVPTARLEVWDGSGHMLHLVDPDRFARRVGSLLGSLPPGP
jgi:pimeloyl-ACP methyl ester carboxylesterase